MCLEATIQFRLYFGSTAIFVYKGKDGVYTIIRFAVELLDLTLTLNDKSDGYTLYTASRECWLYFSPEYRRKFETYDTVEHSTRLLGIYQVHVQMPRMLNGF